jgi:phosphoglycerate dehydrogenase-like enzyme
LRSPVEPTTAFFINTARGKLVDQSALVDALRAREISGAGLDVYEQEPLPADHPLYDLHEQEEYNVTLTPHTAWQGPWTWVRDSQVIWLNVLRALRGEPVQYLVSGPGNEGGEGR